MAALHAGVWRSVAHSMQHQGSHETAPGCVAEAHCPDDGMVVAIRQQGPGCVAAVRWRPEFLDPTDTRISQPTAARPGAAVLGQRFGRSGPTAAGPAPPIGRGVRRRFASCPGDRGARGQGWRIGEGRTALGS